MPMNQKERREYLLHYLFQENTQVTDKRIPSSEQEQKILLRGLFNIRMPRKVTPEFLKIQDEFHFPNEKAAEIAIQTVKEYKKKTESEIKVVFNLHILPSCARI